jgi:hypothetical protein
MGGFLESELVVLTNTLNQNLSDYAGPDVELAVSTVNNAVAPATQVTSLQLPTLDPLTRLGDYGGHIQSQCVLDCYDKELTTPFKVTPPMLDGFAYGQSF